MASGEGLRDALQEDGLRTDRYNSKYHGWQFGSDGKCEYIPAQPDKEPGKSTHCTTFPCIERYGSVWVWMEDEAGEAVSEEARNKKFPDALFGYYEDSGYICNTGSRDLEIDHGLMIENLLDPAHLPFTHEGTLAKRSDAQLIEMKVDWNTCSREKPPANPEEEEWYACARAMDGVGFQTTAYRPNEVPAKQRLGSFTFFAPNNMVLDLKSPSFRMMQVHFNVPITPTKMRIIFYFYRNVGTFVKYIPGQNYLFQWMSDKIIEQDVLLLGGQQVRLRQGARAWNSSVKADTGGVIYRQWRDRAEKANPWWQGFSKIGKNPTGDMEDLCSGVPEEDLYAVPGSSRFQPRERLPFFPKNVQVFLFIALFVLLVALWYAFLQ